MCSRCEAIWFLTPFLKTFKHCSKQLNSWENVGIGLYYFHRHSFKTKFAYNLIWIKAALVLKSIMLFHYPHIQTCIQIWQAVNSLAEKHPPLQQLYLFWYIVLEAMSTSFCVQVLSIQVLKFLIEIRLILIFNYQKV